MNLRKYAAGKPCTVRIPSICNGDVTTTVLAHFRMSGISGMGMKSPDLLAAFACSDCHDAIDRRRFLNLDREYVRLLHLEAVMRTQSFLIDQGLVKW